MKKLLLLIISLYQNFVSTSIKSILGIDRMCKFSPTCSEYAKMTIQKDGIFHGLVKSAARVLKCQPYFSF